MKRCLSLLLALLLVGLCLPAFARTQVLMSFTGDCTLGSENYLRGRPTSFDSYIRQFGYAYPFAKVQHLFSRDDVTVINFEGVLYEHEANKVKKTYNFRGPLDFANILTEGSVELCFLGNNHVEDYGRPGFNSTIEAIEAVGKNWFAVTPFGSRVHVYEKNGIRIGFTGIYVSTWARDPLSLRESFDELKKQDCDFIVGIMHGGGEYSGRQGRGMERLAQAMVSHGAGLVVGHHPHVLHGIELMGDATVLYSLGNFSFGGNAQLRSTQTMVAQVRLDFADDGRYLGQQLIIHPAHPSGTLQYNNFQPVPVSGRDAESIMQLLQRMSPVRLKPYRLGLGAVQDYVPVRAPLMLYRKADIAP